MHFHLQKCPLRTAVGLHCRSLPCYSGLQNWGRVTSISTNNNKEINKMLHNSTLITSIFSNINNKKNSKHNNRCTQNNIWKKKKLSPGGGREEEKKRRGEERREDTHSLTPHPSTLPPHIYKWIYNLPSKARWRGGCRATYWTKCPSTGRAKGTKPSTTCGCVCFSKHKDEKH